MCYISNTLVLSKQLEDTKYTTRQHSGSNEEPTELFKFFSFFKMEFIAAVPLLSIDSDTKTDNLVGRQTRIVIPYLMRLII